MAVETCERCGSTDVDVLRESAIGATGDLGVPVRVDRDLKCLGCGRTWRTTDYPRR